jgi:exodeoxyribonuclease V beta subunit
VLDQNFRSRPAVLRALQALYDNGGEDAFLERDIQFEPVRPGGVRIDADTCVMARPPWHLPCACCAVAVTSNERRCLACGQTCVAAIHQILVDARAGNAVRGRPVQPGDIAVLVRSHREATLVQRAAAVGIPAVAAGKPVRHQRSA